MKTFEELTREDKIKLIAAWVDGSTIQFFSTSSKEWLDIQRPMWHPDSVYRIKHPKSCAGKTVEIDGVKYKLVEV